MPVQVTSLAGYRRRLEYSNAPVRRSIPSRFNKSSVENTYCLSRCNVITILQESALSRRSSAVFVWYGTNEYNFVKLQNPPEYVPTKCSRCGVVICLGEDGHSISPGRKYFCDDAQKRILEPKNVEQGRERGR